MSRRRGLEHACLWDAAQSAVWQAREQYRTRRHREQARSRPVVLPHAAHGPVAGAAGGTTNLVRQTVTKF